MSQNELTDDDAVATFSDMKIRPQGRIGIPKKTLDKHNLRNAVIDVRITKADRSIAVMDVETDSKGRFTIPARKRRLYGIECGEYVSGAIDAVIRP
jgi:bifunctional DNA-binding transcriptional regulator/antitoxin component of YhaV-PrlF toxin-antitoxin module